MTCLSAVVAVLCGAGRLVIFSDIDGFYDSDPRFHPDAKLIERVTVIDEETEKLAGGAGSRRGTGGMRTKLEAARLATAQGTDVIITNGKKSGSAVRYRRRQACGYAVCRRRPGTLGGREIRHERRNL